MAEDKGFKVYDKRYFSSTPEEREKIKEKEATENQEKKVESSEKKEKRAGRLPELSFSTFIFSLGSSALVQLGEIPDPVTQKHETNLDLAKQTIDILGMLQQKTKGNLTGEEEQVMENLLYDLKLIFVQKSKR